MAFFGLIPAAGSGSRIGGPVPKQYRPVAGRPLIRYALDAFAAAPGIARAYVVLSPEDAHYDQLGLPAALAEVSPVLRVGGETRQESVLNGLDALQGVVQDEDWILVHDAARPGLTQALIARLIEALRNDPVGGLLALPVADTLKRETPGNRANRSAQTLDRAGLWQAQTPQMFRYALLRRALREAAERGGTVTDEASAIEALGLQPRLVIGSARNFKVTYPDDLELAGYMLSGAAE